MSVYIPGGCFHPGQTGKVTNLLPTGFSGKHSCHEETQALTAFLEACQHLGQQERWTYLWLQSLPATLEGCCYPVQTVSTWNPRGLGLPGTTAQPEKSHNKQKLTALGIPGPPDGLRTKKECNQQNWGQYGTTVT